MATVLEDLEHALKYLEEANVATHNAFLLVERVSAPLAEEMLVATRLQDESRDRVRSLLRALESV